MVTLGAAWSNPHEERSLTDRPGDSGDPRLDTRGDWRWSACPAPATARAGRRSILVSFGPNRAIRDGGPEWLWGRAVDGCARCHRCALGAGLWPSCAVTRLAGALNPHSRINGHGARVPPGARRVRRPAAALLHAKLSLFPDMSPTPGPRTEYRVPRNES